MGAFLQYLVQNLTLYEHALWTRKIGGKKCSRLRLRLRLQGAFTRLQKLCKRGSLIYELHSNKENTNYIVRVGEQTNIHSIFFTMNVIFKFNLSFNNTLVF